MAAIFIVMILKSLVLMMAVLILTWFMRRTSAAIRHMYLTAGVVVLLALPLVSLMLPSWEVGWFSYPSPQKELKTIVTTTSARMIETGKVSDTANPYLPSPSPGQESRTQWYDWFWVVWIVGSVGLFFRLLGGKLLAYWESRKASEINDTSFRTTIEEIASRFGVTGKIPVLESTHIKVPFVSGVFRPRLIMPSQATNWPHQRLKNILNHELAHVKRKDILIQFLAQVICCIYWVNPLVWILERQLFLERERACDDMALGQDTKASEYAEHLMEALEEMGNKNNNYLWVVTAMAEGTDFKDRILSILNPTARRGSPGRMHWRAVIILAIVFLLPFASLSPWAATPNPDAKDKNKIEPGNTAIENKNADQKKEARLSLYTELLKSPSPNVRKQAASALGEWGNNQAVPALIEALNDENANVREHVASALRNLGDCQAVPALIRALNDENDNVREHVVSALGNLGDKRAVAPLNEALQKEKNLNVQEHILSALKELH